MKIKKTDLNKAAGREKTEKKSKSRKTEKREEPRLIKGETKPEGKERQAEKEYNPWNILGFPHQTEKSINLVEAENKLVFIVDRRVKKAQIKEAVERGFSVKVKKINFLVTQKGVKKAYVKLASSSDAADIASRLGII